MSGPISLWEGTCQTYSVMLPEAMGANCDDFILIAAIGRVFKPGPRNNVRSALSGVFDLVCTILLGIGSQGACEDCSQSVIPRA